MIGALRLCHAYRKIPMCAMLMILAMAGPGHGAPVWGILCKKYVGIPSVTKDSFVSVGIQKVSFGSAQIEVWCMAVCAMPPGATIDGPRKSKGDVLVFDRAASPEIIKSPPKIGGDWFPRTSRLLNREDDGVADGLDVQGRPGLEGQEGGTDPDTLQGRHSPGHGTATAKNEPVQVHGMLHKQ